LGKVRFMGYVQPPKVGGLDAPLRRFDASQKEDLALLKETIQDAYQDNIKLTVIDTARGASSKSISSPKAAREMLGGLQQIAEETGTCILLLHHTNRRSSRSAYEKIAGSAEMYSYPRCVLSVAPHDTDPSKISLVVPKPYRCASPEPLTYMRNTGGQIEFISGQRPEAAAEYAMQDAAKLGDAIVAFLDEHAPARFSVQQLCCASKRNYDAVAKSAQRLAQAGKIANPVHGFYCSNVAQSKTSAAHLDKKMSKSPNDVQLPAAAAAAPVSSDEKTLVLAPTNGHAKVNPNAETVLFDVLP
jgi:hypothetical protein